MRIAIVMFGMLKCFELTSHFTKKYINNSKSIKKEFPECEFDYFFFGYPNKQGKEYCQNKLQDIYSPKLFEIIEWTSDVQEVITSDAHGLSDLSRVQRGATSPLACLSSYRCRYLANELRKKWATDNDIKHDVIVCIRTDSFFFREILAAELMSCGDDEILIPSDWDFKEVHPAAICDMFAMGNETSMEKYFNAYHNIPKLCRKNFVFHPETALGLHINDVNLKRKIIDRHFIFEFPFSFEEYSYFFENDWTKEKVESLWNLKLDPYMRNSRARDLF